MVESAREEQQDAEKELENFLRCNLKTLEFTGFKYCVPMTYFLF